MGGIEQCALYNVINGLPNDAVNIAVMVYNGNNTEDYKGIPCIQWRWRLPGVSHDAVEQREQNNPAATGYEHWTTTSKDKSPYHV